MRRVRSQHLSLGADAVHVWCARLDRVTGPVACLSREERKRAQGFHYQEHRDQFVSRRCVLRQLLGRYTDLSPEQLRYSTGPYGRLSLGGGSDSEPISFSLSHSYGLALYAFARGREVGIDLEKRRPEVDCMEVARMFFSRREFQGIEFLPRGARTVPFFTLWTCKEAFVKAIGMGLSFPLDQVEVSLDESDVQILSLRGSAEEAARWSLRRLFPAEGYSAALAVEGHHWRLQCRDWPDTTCGVACPSFS